MRITPLPFLAVLAALLVTGVALAPGPPPGFGRDWYDRALGLAESYGMFGGFVEVGDRYVGTFVELRLDQDGVTLHEYTVKKPFGDVAVFDRIEVPGASPGASVVDGSELALTSPQVVVRAHNNPLGSVRHLAMSGVAVVYSLAQGVVATLEDNLAFVAGNGLRGGIAVLGGSVQASGGQVIVTLGPGDSSVFRAHLVDGEGVAGRAEQDALLDAIARGALAAEDFEIGLEGGVAQDTVAYNDVRLSATPVEGGVRVVVEATLPSGRSIALHVHRDLLGPSTGGDLVVELDGQLLARAGTAQAVLEGPTARYHASTSEQGSLVALYIPSFSVHTVVIRGIDDLPLSPLGTVGILASVIAVALVVASAIVAVRSERKKW